jgi:hypothetical protein
MYTAQWEEYNTGRFTYQQMGIGVTESHFMTIGLLLMQGFSNSNIGDTTFGCLFGMASDLPKGSFQLSFSEKTVG